jgi:hypothetical protein
VQELAATLQQLEVTTTEEHPVNTQYFCASPLLQLTKKCMKEMAK